MSSENRFPKEDDNRLIAWGLAGSAIFITLFLLVAAFKGFWSLALNEMGDALAGFFSCLAFLWLVLTIQLQKRELRLQRIELATATDVYRQQTAELAGTKEVSEQQLNLLRVNQQMLFKDYVLRGEDESVRSVLSHILYDIVPALESIDSIVAAVEQWSTRFEQARLLFSGERISESLILTSSIFLEANVNLDNKKSALTELASIRGFRERLDVLEALLFAYYSRKYRAGNDARIHYYFGVRRVESELKWLLDHRAHFPSADKVFTEHLNEMRRSFENSTEA